VLLDPAHLTRDVALEVRWNEAGRQQE